jgi:thiol:disulfide interchange protein DsbC
MSPMNDRGRSRARLRLTLGALSAFGTSLALSLAVSLAAHAAGSVDSDAEAARVLDALRAAHPGTAFLRVEHTPVPGLFEVRLAGAVAYVLPGSTRHMLFGRLFDLETLSDLTAPKLASHDGDGDGDGNDDAEARNASEPASIAQPPTSATVLPHELPLADAITTLRGNGARHLVVFSDPGCPYCRHLEHALAGIDNVTVHTFLVPFLGEAAPVAIWCTPERAQAWRRWMLDEDRSALAPEVDCAHPIGRNQELARRLQVRGTPTLIWADGQRAEGLLSREAIEARLDAVAQEQRP